jgi:hypothetical protein
MKFKESLNLQGQTVSIGDELGRIDLDNLKQEIAETEARHIFYGICHAKAGRLANLAKLHVDITKAQVEKDIRTRSVSLDRKMTEAAVLAEVTLDEKVIQAQKDFFAALEAKEMLMSAYFGAGGKAGILKEITGQVRDELFVRNIPKSLSEKMAADFAAERAKAQEVEQGGIIRQPVS